ncbi:hypothetical protein [Wolbachia endosymbiont of Frankliniella intonsa]
MPFIPRYFTYSSMTFSPLFSICSFYSGNWYKFFLMLVNSCKSLPICCRYPFTNPTVCLKPILKKLTII